MSQAVDQLAPTAVEGEQVVFRLTDPEHRRAAPRLWCDVDLGADPAMTPVTGGWELRLPLPDLDCLEYMFETGAGLETDPGNPRRVDGAFGAHSWLPLPGYAEPAWLAEESVPAERAALAVRRTAVGRVDVLLWSPADAAAGEELPLLLAHDGPELDEYAALTHFVGTGIAAGRLPRMRVALLAPGDRNPRYSANPAYAAALVGPVLTAVRQHAPTRYRPVLSGQSLGGLAALHAAWTSPGTFGGLFLQSGSFFTPETDPQESGFAHWKAVTGFVASLRAASRAAPDSPRTTITCGTAEENLANNRLVADHLRATGVQVAWGEARQGHTWTCWRDLLDPHLTELLTSVWRS